MIDGEASRSQTEFRVYSSLHTANRSRVTRTHHSRALDKPQKKRPPEAGTRTHTQYTLLDECIAPGPMWFHPSPVAPVGLSITRAVSEPPTPRRTRTPPPAPLPLRVSPNQPARTSGAGAAAPTVSPPSGESTVYGRHGACVATRAACCAQKRSAQESRASEAPRTAPGEQDRRVCAESRSYHPQLKVMGVPSALKTVWPARGVL